MDKMTAVVEGEVLEATLSAGDFTNTSTGEKINYRNWKLRVFNRGNADICDVTLPGKLADESGVPSQGDVVAYRCEITPGQRGGLNVKATHPVALAKPNGHAAGIPAAPPAARK